MEMIVHLDSDVFEIVKDGSKNVEVRVYDQKRRQLKRGDILLFLKRPDDVEEIRVVIDQLVLFSSFSEVVDAYDMEKIYLKDTSREDYLQLMKRFYSDEEVENNGIVAIEFHKI